MNRRWFLRRTAALAAASPWVCTPGLGADTLRTAEEERLLAEAEEGIRRHRESAGVLCVLGDGNRPLPEVRVRIEQRRQQFLFGANCFQWRVPGQQSLEAAYRERFAGLFNFASLGVFWASFEPEPDRPRYEELDAVVAWCAQHGITCLGTPLVWPNLPDPTWLPKTEAGIREASHRRVRDLVSRYRERIRHWVVVNEPTMLPWSTTRYGAWAMLEGTVPYVAEHLRTARAANPAATLLVNDCLTEVPLYPLLDRLREGGQTLYDAVGIQSHMHLGPWPLQRVRTVCDEYARLGVPLHFTEVTLLSGQQLAEERWSPTSAQSEAAQADQVVSLYTMLYGHPAVQGITWWDFTDLNAWKRAPAGLVREDMSPKPAYEALRQLIRERWWTRVQGHTDAGGEFHFRAVHGVLKVHLDHPSGRRSSFEVAWPGGPSKRIQATLTAK